MIPLVHFWRLLEQVSPVAAGILLGSIWESLLLVGGTTLVLRLLREASPERRTMVWTAVLVLLLLLPGLALYAPHGTARSGGVVHVFPAISLWFAGLWIAGSAVRLGLLGRQLAHFAGVRRRAVPASVLPEIADVLQDVRGAALYVSDEVSRPCLAGLLRPRVLFPTGVLEQLSPEELRQVLLHEMEHLRRGDDWLNLLQQVSLVVLPLNPALIWLDHCLSRDRELACDDGVLRRGAGAKGYAAVLVRLAELSLAWRGTALALSLLGAQGRETELGGRVKRLLAGGTTSGRQERRWSVPIAAVLSAGFAALLALCPSLVRFDRMPVVASLSMAAAGTPARDGAAAMVPVVAPMQAGRVAVPSMRVLPVGAEAPRPRVYRRIRFSATAHRPRAERASFRTSVTASAGTWSAGRTGRPAIARVMLTGLEFSQPLYAAVPVQGGWLIVQL